MKKRANFKHTESDTRFNLSELKVIDTEEMSKRSKMLLRKEDKNINRIFNKKKIGEKVLQGKKGMLRAINTFKTMFKKNQE